MKVFVGGLPLDMDDQEFKEIFEDYGTVSSAKIILDRETGKSRGFGFVDFPERSAAEKAIVKLNGGEMDGRKLTVNVAEDRKPRENSSGTGISGPANAVMAGIDIIVCSSPLYWQRSALY